MIREMHHLGACALWTGRMDEGVEIGPEGENLSFESFAVSHLGYVTGRLGDWDC